MWLLLVLIATVARAQVLPDFNCWFPTYANGARLVNLVFSYNNTQNGSDVILPINATTNQLFPASFDGQQSDVFKVGFQAFVLILTDTDDTLGQGGAIGWLLDGSVSNVTSAQITPQLRCGAALSGSCPIDPQVPQLQYFCDDGVYCNGQETCFSMSVFGVQTTRTMGVCVAANAGVQCSAGAHCDESVYACVTPTASPTQAPTLQPTVAPTAQPTPGPTALVTQAPEIVPLFYCWFYTEEPLVGMVVNLGLGYNNTASRPLTRPVTIGTSGDTVNNIAPIGYNGPQPILFQPGTDLLAHVLKDLTGVLLRNGTITWRLTMDTLVVTLDMLTPSAECSVLEPPTSEDLEILAQCTVMAPDCTSFDTFCHGVTQCNFSTNLCDPVNPAYNPCLGLQSQIPPQAPIVLTCLEPLQQCVAYVNCTVDEQCNDGLICNGREYCVNNGTTGVCYGQANLTILSLCGNVNAVCDEGVGCQSTTQVSPRTMVAIAGAVILVGGIVVLFLYFAFSSGGSPRMPKMKK